MRRAYIATVGLIVTNGALFWCAFQMPDARGLVPLIGVAGCIMMAKQLTPRCDS